MTTHTLAELGDVARVVATRIREDAANIDLDIRHPRLTMENHAKDLDRLADKLTDESAVVRCAHCGDPIDQFDDDSHWTSLGEFGGTGTGALSERVWCVEAANHEHSPDAERPLLDRGALVKAIADEFNDYPEGLSFLTALDGGILPTSQVAALAAGAVMPLARPLPTREQVAAALHNSQMIHKRGDDCPPACDTFLRPADAVLALLNGSAAPMQHCGATHPRVRGECVFIAGHHDRSNDDWTSHGNLTGWTWNDQPAEDAS